MRNTQEGTVLAAQAGQMSVEAAIMLPILIVLAFVLANLLFFAESCVAFDRIAYDAVVMHGVSLAGEQEDQASEEAVGSAIAEALGREETCEVDVEASSVSRSSGAEGSFSLLPALTRYECTLRFHPWGTSFSIAGATFAPPFDLPHTRELTVDRFRPGVVI